MHAAGKLHIVMPALVAGIHVFLCCAKTWMAGSSARSKRFVASPGHDGRATGHYNGVITGLVPVIHVLALLPQKKTWMAGTSPAMTTADSRVNCLTATPPRSRRAMRPSCALTSAQEKRAQGMPGARCTRSLACKNKKAYEHSHHGHTGVTRHSPRNGFNGFLRALPGDRAFLSPSPCVYRKT